MRVSNVIMLLVLWTGIGLSPLGLSAQSTDQKRMTVSPDRPITFPSTEPFAPSRPSSGDSSPDPALIGPSSGVHFGQDIQLQSDKTVEQIQLILGSATVDGHVRGDVFVFGGNLAVTETAKVEGKTKVYLGRIVGKQNLIAGTFQETNGFNLVLGVIKFIQYPERIWFGNSYSSIVWTIASISVMFVVYLMIAGILPTQMTTMEEAISRRIIGSTIIGVLIFLLLMGLFWFAVFSIIGIPLLILLFSLLVPMAIYGKAAVFTSLGYSLISRDKSVLWAVVLGYILYQLALRVWPLLSLPTFVLVSALGVSATIRTVFGSRSIRNRTSPLSPQNYSYSSRNQSSRD